MRDRSASQARNVSSLIAASTETVPIPTAEHAAHTYKAFLELKGIESELFDAIEQIYFQEERAVDELNQLIEG